jgi:hypothetical protein
LPHTRGSRSYSSNLDDDVNLSILKKIESITTSLVSPENRSRVCSVDSDMMFFDCSESPPGLMEAPSGAATWPPNLSLEDGVAKDTQPSKMKKKKKKNKKKGDHAPGICEPAEEHTADAVTCVQSCQISMVTSTSTVQSGEVSASESQSTMQTSRNCSEASVGAPPRSEGGRTRDGDHEEGLVDKRASVADSESPRHAIMRESSITEYLMGPGDAANSMGNTCHYDIDTVDIDSDTCSGRCVDDDDDDDDDDDHDTAGGGCGSTAGVSHGVDIDGSRGSDAASLGLSEGLSEGLSIGRLKAQSEDVETFFVKRTWRRQCEYKYMCVSRCICMSACTNICMCLELEL